MLTVAWVSSDYTAHMARGQYTTGWQGGQLVRSYLEEDGVSPDSRTETYTVIRVDVDNRRWTGVPSYPRAAKRMPRWVTETALMSKQAPHLPFPTTETATLGQGALVICIQPDESVTLRFGIKVPGTQMEIHDVFMDFAYGGSFTETPPGTYECLILDMLLGDPPLSLQHREVELGRKTLGPVFEYWDPLFTQSDPYAAGTWGPASTVEMLARDGSAWHRP